MCFDSLYNFSLKHFSLYEQFSKTLSSMYSYTGLHVMYLNILVRLHWNLTFSVKSRMADLYETSLIPAEARGSSAETSKPTPRNTQPPTQRTPVFFTGSKAAGALGWPLTSVPTAEGEWEEHHLYAPYMPSRRGQEQLYFYVLRFLWCKKFIFKIKWYIYSV
jgi:hypothetical protein